MALPFLQSYSEPKQQKAYERCLGGQSLRKIATTLRVPLRTLARWSKSDGWVEERKARALATSAPNVATAATAVPGEPQATGTESRAQGMERMLASQQHVASLLSAALRRDVEKTIADASTAGKPLTRAQLAQLASLTNNILAIERKAWCVPDKIETKDVTPAKVDEVRKLTDEELDRRITEAAGRVPPPARGEEASGSVN